MIKDSHKKRLEKLEKQNEDIESSSGCVVIYNPELPIPDLSQYGKRTIILLPDNQMSAAE